MAAAWSEETRTWTAFCKELRQLRMAADAPSLQEQWGVLCAVHPHFFSVQQSRDKFKAAQDAPVDRHNILDPSTATTCFRCKGSGKMQELECPQTCSVCSFGYLPGKEYTRCFKCKGSAHNCSACHCKGYLAGRDVQRCPDCEGKGSRNGIPCATCRGACIAKVKK